MKRPALAAVEQSVFRLTKSQLPRRTFLRGIGTALSLPLLEAMTPAVKLFAGSGLASPASPPRRMAFMFVPNGVNMTDWTPKAEGADFELP